MSEEPLTLIQQIQAKVNDIGRKAGEVRGFMDVWNDGAVTFLSFELSLTPTIKAQMKAQAKTLIDEIAVLAAEVKALIP